MGTNFHEIWTGILPFPLKKIHLIKFHRLPGGKISITGPAQCGVMGEIANKCPSHIKTTGPVRFLATQRFLAHKAEGSARRNVAPVPSSWSQQAVSKLRISGPFCRWFPSQMANKAESVSMSWRYRIAEDCRSHGVYNCTTASVCRLGPALISPSSAANWHGYHYLYMTWVSLSVYDMGITICIWHGYHYLYMTWVSLSVYDMGITICIWHGYHYLYMTWVSLSVYDMGITICIWHGYHYLYHYMCVHVHACAHMYRYTDITMV